MEGEAERALGNIDRFGKQTARQVSEDGPKGEREHDQETCQLIPRADQPTLPSLGRRVCTFEADVARAGSAL